jgi:molybdate transport system substrate-binding protein
MTCDSAVACVRTVLAPLAARLQTSLLGLAVSTLALGTTTPARAAALTLWGADSLNGALRAVAKDFTTAGNPTVTMDFAPSGMLRKRIEGGARPDLFASADTANPLALEHAGLAGPVVHFATNRIVAVAKPGLKVTSDTLLSTLLNPAVTVGTSTPRSDPLGDYTEQVFAKANTLLPGSTAKLDAKVKHLMGGPASPKVPGGQNKIVYFIKRTHQADVFLTYASLARAALTIAPDLQEIELPGSLAMTVEFGLTVLKGADPGSDALKNYILSPAGQAVLAKDGFGPPASTPP